MNQTQSTGLTVETIPQFSRGTFSEIEFPKWQEGEDQSGYLKRIGYDEIETLGHDDFEPTLTIYEHSITGKSEYLVEVFFGFNSVLIYVPDFLSALMLLNQFAPLAKAVLLQRILDLWTGRGDDKPGLEEILRSLVSRL